MYYVRMRVWERQRGTMSIVYIYGYWVGVWKRSKPKKKPEAKKKLKYIITTLIAHIQYWRLFRYWLCHTRTPHIHKRTLHQTLWFSLFHRSQMKLGKSNDFTHSARAYVCFNFDCRISHGEIHSQALDSIWCGMFGLDFDVNCIISQNLIVWA